MGEKKYSKTTWKTGDLITSEKMNNIEEYLEYLEHIDSIMTSKKATNRIFKPRFGINAYWAEASDIYGNHYSGKIQNIYADILMWDSHGCDEITIPIQISYNANTSKFYIVNNLDDMLSAVIYAEQNHNIRVTSIKVHLQRATQETVNEHGVDDFKIQYKALLETIAKKFVGTTVKNMTVLNELGWIYEADSYEDFSLECLSIAKSNGYSTGVTSAGFTNFYKIKESVINNSDKIFVNTYPYVSSKKDNTTIEDVVNGWKCNYDVEHIKKIKKMYPTKQIIISECGVQDYWDALIVPSYWQWVNLDLTKTNGLAPSYYLTGLFETLNINEIESVWWWYDLEWNTTKEVCNFYLKGEVSE